MEVAETDAEARAAFEAFQADAGGVHRADAVPALRRLCPAADAALLADLVELVEDSGARALGWEAFRRVAAAARRLGGSRDPRDALYCACGDAAGRVGAAELHRCLLLLGAAVAPAEALAIVQQVAGSADGALGRAQFRALLDFFCEPPR